MFTDSWPTATPASANPWDALSRDQLLTMHLELKKQLDKLKDDEMKLRKYIVAKAFPEAKEGMNTQELGNGYELKAGVKYNYNLKANTIVEEGLEELSKTGNDGSFIAERLVSWTPNFLLTEYREIQLLAEEGNELAKQRLYIISKFMTITEGAPTLEIKEPKGKKK
jgi:hypothetical protein